MIAFFKNVKFTIIPYAGNPKPQFPENKNNDGKVNCVKFEPRLLVEEHIAVLLN